jgi:hypothetical protein
MRNVNAKIGYIVNNVWWGKYDQKIISNIGPDLYDIVVDSALLGVRDILKITLYSQIENELEKEHKEY